MIALKYGDMLGFETDTVWGLGCLPDDKTAVERIYEIKDRNKTKPLILMSNSIENLMPYVFKMPDYAKILIDKHFPGALTLIFKKTPFAKDFITSGQNTVGIRVPNHKGFSKLCQNIEGGVLATTSLNPSGEPPVANYKEAVEKFGDTVKILKPANPCNIGISSTVVLCTGDKPVILRQGSVIIEIS